MHQERQKRGHIRVLVADGRHLFREGICRILEQQDSVDVIAEASHYQTVKQLVVATPLDVVVMNMELPGWDWSTLPTSSRYGQHRPAYVVLSVPPTAEAVARTLESGATGFLLRDAGHRELEDGVQSAAAGETFMCPTIFRTILAEFLQHIDEEKGFNALDAFGALDRDILNRLEQGDTARAIARSLGVDDQAVLEHRRCLMAHLGVEDSDALLLEAQRIGLLTSGEGEGSQTQYS